MTDPDTFRARLDKLVQSARTSGVSDRDIRNALWYARAMVWPCLPRPDDLIGVAEAAALLRRSVRTIHRLIQYDWLRGWYGPGNHLRLRRRGVRLVRRADVLALLAIRSGDPSSRPGPAA